MKSAPEEIDPVKYPELACLQAIVHDEERPPEGRGGHTFKSLKLFTLLNESLHFPHSSPEQASSLKDEGNAFFKEKNYKKAILAYTAGLKKKCGDQDLNTVLLTNRAAAHFHLGEDFLCICHTDTFIALVDCSVYY